jgi:MFS family permease
MFERLRPVPALSEEEIERGLRATTRDGLCSQAMGTFTTGTFLVGYALSLGANNTMIGVLAAIPFLANLLQVPTVLLVERIRMRKAIVVVSNIVGRLALLMATLVPLLPTTSLRMTVLIACFIVYNAGAAVSGSTWNSWMRDLVPEDRFGRYFGNRLFLATALGMVLSFAAAFAIDGWKGWMPDDLDWGYAILFGFGAAVGLSGLYFLAVTPEPAMAAPTAHRTFRETLSQPFRELNFRRLILFLASWNFAVNLAAPFFTVYMLGRLGFDMTFVIVVTVVSQAANLVVVRTFGRFADRFSNKSVLAVCAPLFIACIFAWTFTTLPERHAGTVPLLIVIHILMGVATAGVTLGSANIALELAPRGQATAYLGAVSLVNSIAAGIAPIIGGASAEFFASQELALIVRWTKGVTEFQFDTLSLRHWDFFFLMATIVGLYSIHRLTLVAEEGEVQEREVLRELALEARRSIRNLSTVGGLRAGSLFPIDTLRRPFRRNNGKANGNGSGPDNRPAP